MLKADILIVLAAILAAFVFVQHTDAEAIQDLSAQQDAEAMASREWAGQQACGPYRTAVWEGDKTLTCLRNLDHPLSVAGGRP